MDYSQKLKDPRWQKLRLKVLERDEWTCQNCGDTKNTLHIHHRNYLKDIDPWDSPMDNLITLCEDCHNEERENRASYEQGLLYALREKFLCNSVSELGIAFHMMPIIHMPNVTASVYSFALEDEATQKMLIKRYFNHLKKT